MVLVALSCSPELLTQEPFTAFLDRFTDHSRLQDIDFVVLGLPEEKPHSIQDEVRQIYYIPKSLKGLRSVPIHYL